MKRTNKEIQYAISLLKKKSDALSKVQIEVLEKDLNSAAVFERFVTSLNQKDYDEQIYFSARDAASYLSGKLGLEEFIPGAKPYINTNSENKSKQITELTARVAKLERMLLYITKNYPVSEPDIKNVDDLITPSAARKLIGCTKCEFKQFRQDGMLHVKLYQGRYHYSKSEIQSSQLIKKYIDEHPRKSEKK